jgi:hypothetical protein
MLGLIIKGAGQAVLHYQLLGFSYRNHPGYILSWPFFKTFKKKLIFAGDD